MPSLMSHLMYDHRPNLSRLERVHLGIWIVARGLLYASNIAKLHRVCSHLIEIFSINGEFIKIISKCREVHFLNCIVRQEIIDATSIMIHCHY